MTCAVVALIVVAAAVRFGGLGAQSYWGDEALTVSEVGAPHFGGMLGLVLGQETTPPLYFVVAWAWAKVFGTGEAGLRSLSALAGTALVPVAYATAARLFTRRVGLVAAGLVAVNPFLVWYSQEARAYALYMLLGALSFLCFVVALRDRDDRWLAAWAAASALALMSHFFAVFLVAPEAVWLLRSASTRRTVTAVGGVILVGVALVPMAIVDLAHGTTWIGHSPLVQRIGTTAGEFAIGSAARWSWFGGWMVVFAGAAAGAVTAVPFALHGRERRAAGLALVIGGLAVGIPISMALVGADYLNARNLAVAWLPLSVVVAAGLGSRRAGGAGLAGATLLCLCSLGATVAMSTRGDLQRPDWRAIAAQIGPVGPARVVVADASGAEPLRLYLRDVARGRETALTVISEIDLVRRVPGAGRHAGCRRLSCLPALPPLPVEGVRPIAVRHARIGNYAMARWSLRRPARITARFVRAAVIRALDPSGAGRVLVVVQDPRVRPRGGRGARGQERVS